MNIDKFKREHVDILASVAALRDLVHSGVQEHAETILAQLFAMSSAIKLHLAAEDRMLYPALAVAADPLTAQTGEEFQHEMGKLAATYAAFAGRWNTAAKIAADAQGFKEDANAIFKALHQRIQRENRVLYPLAERA